MPSGFTRHSHLTVAFTGTREYASHALVAAGSACGSFRREFWRCDDIALAIAPAALLVSVVAAGWDCRKRGDVANIVYAKANDLPTGIDTICDQ